MRHRRFSWPVAASAALGPALIIVFGVWLRSIGAPPLATDVWWRDQVRLTSPSALLSIALALHVVGGVIGTSICVAAVAIVQCIRGRWRSACAIVTAGVLGALCSEAMKAFVERARPPEPMAVEVSFSYPSGHSMGAAVLAVSIALMVTDERGRASVASFVAWGCAGVWILALMWSRCALSVHWLTDTIAGALLGVSMVLVSRLVFDPGLRPPLPSVRESAAS